MMGQTNTIDSHNYTMQMIVINLHTHTQAYQYTHQAGTLYHIHTNAVTELLSVVNSIARQRMSSIKYLWRSVDVARQFHSRRRRSCHSQLTTVLLIAAFIVNTM
eukprot:scpid65536/ scgid13145/ 